MQIVNEFSAASSCSYLNSYKHTQTAIHTYKYGIQTKVFVCATVTACNKVSVVERLLAIDRMENEKLQQQN